MDFTFILVEPAVPGNIGAAARAMKNMGFVDLILVRPCDHLHPEARKFAHGSEDVLRSAAVVNRLEEVAGDFDLFIGTTARKRRIKEDYLSPEKLKKVLEKKRGTVASAAIVFGSEKYGLSNEDLSLCHITSGIPLRQRHPSLNLAQSVMVYAYVLGGVPEKTTGTESIPDECSQKALWTRVNRILKDAGILPDSLIYNRIMERFMLLGDDDLHLLHSVCNGIEEKMR